MCEQLVYTSAPRTLDGSGFGVLARSAGWPADPGRSAADGFPAVVSFLPQGATHRMTGGAPPQCLALYDVGGQRVAVRKTYRGGDDMGRPGNFLAHGLLDSSGRLTAHDVFALWDADLPWRELPAGLLPTADLPSVPVAHGRYDGAALPHRRAGRARGSSDGAAVAARIALALSAGRADTLPSLLPLLVAAVLGRARHGRPVTVEVDDPLDGVLLVGGLLAVLPDALAARLTFSTFEKNPAGSGVDVAVADTRFAVAPTAAGASAGAVVSVPQRQVRLELAVDAERHAAAELVSAWLSEDVTALRAARSAETVADLLDWARLRRSSRLPAADLTDEELVLLVRSPLAAEWLRQPPNRAVLLDSVATGHRGHIEAVGVALRRGRLPAAARADLVGELLDRAVTSTLAGPDHTAAAAGLVRLLETLEVEPERIALAVVAAADERLAAGRTVPFTQLWPHLQRAAADLPAQVRRRWLDVPGVATAAAADWSALTDTLVEHFLSAPRTGWQRPMSRLLREHPAEVGQVADRLLAAGGEAEQLLAALLGVAVPAQLRHVAVALLSCPHLPRGFVLTELLGAPELSPADRHALLTGMWPQIAAQAGIPDQVAALLVPAPEPPVSPGCGGRRWWRGRRSRPPGG